MKLLIIGAGGLGRVISEIAQSLNLYSKISFLDDAVRAADVVGKSCDYTIMKDEYDCAVASLGDNELRLEWTNKLLCAGFNVPSIIHPSAYVAPSAEIGKGCLILHKAVVSSNTKLGLACLINSAAVVDHNNILGDGVHINLNSCVKAWCNLEPCLRTEAGDIVYPKRRKIFGVDNANLEEALFAFRLSEVAEYVKPFGSGHINDTYSVYVKDEKTNEEQLRYIIQRINKNVFKNPRAVMDNIFGVTEYLRRIILKNGGDADREALNYIKTKSGAKYFEDAEQSPWRCYNFIADSVCIEAATSDKDFYNAGKSFGSFLCLLQDYPADTLTETIEKFHDTRNRLKDFKIALERDVKNRAQSCKKECEFILAREADCAVLMDLLEQGILPLRVTHNDTKLNNILFDKNSGEALCVIDLDTIMPGLALNDYGDSIRFGASTAAEDEPDLNKVHLSLSLFEAYTKGYLEQAGATLTEAEKDYLPWGAKLMTLECGTRFLTDYLQGDTYFKVSRPLQNLERCRTQYKLVQEMEDNWSTLQQIVAKYR